MQMQKKAAFSVFLVCVLTLTVYRLAGIENLYSSYVFPILNRISVLGFGYFVAYVFPPNDYYDSLVLHRIDRGECVAKFSCKYKGSYQMKIKNVQSDSPYSIGIKVMGQIEWNNGENAFLFCQKHSYLFVHYDKNDNKGYNYHYSSFDVPKDVPLDTEVSVNVRFSGELDEFLKTNPDAVFEIVKSLDK